MERFAEAIDHLREAMVLFTRLSAQLDLVMALNCLGEVHSQAGDPAASAQAHERAVTLAREQGSIFEEARAHRGLGRAAEIQGVSSRASRELRQALDLFRQLSALDADEVAEELARLDESHRPNGGHVEVSRPATPGMVSGRGVGSDRDEARPER